MGERCDTLEGVGVFTEPYEEPDPTINWRAVLAHCAELDVEPADLSDEQLQKFKWED